MDKRVKISYSEQSKAVVADVTIEYSFSGSDISDLIHKHEKEMLNESMKVFEEAQKFSHLKTLEKNR